MPFQWLQVLAHPSTTDKSGLLLNLKYEMTIADVYDLLEYHSYENWVNYESNKKQNNLGG